ncbi:hypothetical protein I9X38_19085 [Bacillus mojavensis]|nr:hypothetical protein I9X38_19085 [Bacillus mojavensis]
MGGGLNSQWNRRTRFKDKRSYCALTSAKPNIGHTLAASGVVSLISLRIDSASHYGSVYWVTIRFRFGRHF